MQWKAFSFWGPQALWAGALCRNYAYNMPVGCYTCKHTHNISFEYSVKWIFNEALIGFVVGLSRCFTEACAGSGFATAELTALQIPCRFQLRVIRRHDGGMKWGEFKWEGEGGKRLKDEWEMGTAPWLLAIDAPWCIYSCLFCVVSTSARDCLERQWDLKLCSLTHLLK